MALAALLLDLVQGAVVGRLLVYEDNVRAFESFGGGRERIGGVGVRCLRLGLSAAKTRLVVVFLFALVLAHVLDRGRVDATFLSFKSKDFG